MNQKNKRLLQAQNNTSVPDGKSNLYPSRALQLLQLSCLLTVCFLVRVPSDVAFLWFSLRVSNGGAAINIMYGINSGVLRIFNACKQTKQTRIEYKLIISQARGNPDRLSSSDTHLGFRFTSLCDWFTKLAPFSQPMRNKVCCDWLELLLWVSFYDIEN